jgi:hypothetical protein
MKPSKAEPISEPTIWPQKEVFIIAVEQLFRTYDAWNKSNFIEEMSNVTKMGVETIAARYAKKENQQRDGIEIEDDTVTLITAAPRKPARAVK